MSLRRARIGGPDDAHDSKFARSHGNGVAPAHARAARLPPPPRGHHSPDGFIHVIGIAAGLIGAAMLVIAAATRGSPLELAALAAYSGGLLAMLACSAAYQLLRSSR